MASGCKATTAPSKPGSLRWTRYAWWICRPRCAPGNRPRDREQTRLCELARVLPTGGLLVLRVPAVDALRSRHYAFVLERQRFTRTRRLKLAAAAGIRVLRCSYANALLLPIARAKFRIG